MTDQPKIQLIDVHKSFGPKTVLDGVTVDIAAAVTEFGLFTQASNAGGTMWTHICFSVVNLGIGDTLQSTYTLTIP